MAKATAADQELEKLRVRLAELLCQRGITEAIVVDDDLVRVLGAGQWSQAVALLRTQDPAGFQKLRQLITDKGTGRIEDLPPDEVLSEAVGLINASSSAGAKAVFEHPPYRDASLDTLASLLKSVGLLISPHTNVTREAPSRGGRLYFLDYRLQPEADKAGHDAAGLLQQILTALGEQDAPPAAVLMSRGRQEHPTRAEWEQVARDAGYYRFNFRYMDKVILSKPPMEFLFFLLELVESLPLGSAYYAQLRAMRQAASTAAEAAMGTILLLTPAEFSIFAAKHLGDSTGRKATRHLLDLFFELVETRIKDGPELERAFSSFAQTLKTATMPATSDMESHTLHRIHTELLYDRSRWVLGGPVEFGDMFHRSQDPHVFYLVVTPECDLELRDPKGDGNWAPKADEIMLLRGEVKLERAPKEREDVIGKPFLSDPAGKERWMWWHLRKRVIVPTKDLLPQPAQTDASPPVAPTAYVKWGRLRLVEAEQIQQKFASDFLEVGVDEVYRKATLLEAEVRHLPGPGEKGDRVGVVQIIETPNPDAESKDGPFWALGEGCDSTLCAKHGEQCALPWEVVYRLRTAVLKKDFKKICESNKVSVLEVEGRWFLLKCPREVRGNWKP